jgi:PKD repeat protein
LAGDFNISLKAGNAYGDNTTQKINYINVSDCNTPPVVSFTTSVTCGVAPFWVMFNDTSTGVGITNWSWDFGDGNTSTTQNPLHQYNFTGSFPINHSATNYVGTTWLNGTVTILSKNIWESCTGTTTGVQYDTNNYKPGWFNTWWF